MSTQISQCLRQAALMLVLALAGGGCVAPPRAAPRPLPPLAETAQVAHIVGPAGTATLRPLPPGVLYQDDFTDPTSGWPKIIYDNYYIGYHEPNHYHVEVDVPNDKAIVSVPKRKFGDFTIEVKALVEPNNTAQTGDFRYGLMFRRSGNNYYAFAISPQTKTWYVLKNSPSAMVELKKGSTDAIQGLKTDDVLRVDIKGSNFTFRINDKILGQISDTSYITGEAGFMVETFDSLRVHIHFGLLNIREVGAPSPSAVLYQDDFTDPTSGWPKIIYDNYYIGYHEPNHYHVEVDVPNDKAIVSVPKRKFEDFTIEVKALVEPNNTAQTGDFRYGLMFRRSGNNYYAFAISPQTKTWYVLKNSPSAMVELKKGSTDAIQGLKTDDVLRVDIKGSNFTFRINDKILGQISDTSYITGEAGFMVETFDSLRVHIHFGLLNIREVDAS